MKERTTYPLTIDRIVTVGVDIQHDFIDGSLAVPGGEEIITPMNALTRYTRDLGGVAVFTRDWHPEVTEHFKKWPVHCVAETFGAEFHEDLDIQPEDIIVSKGMSTKDDGYSGFEGVSDDGQTLETIIRPRTARERVAVVIGGLATDYCDLATVLSSLETFKDNKNVSTVAVIDAMRAVNLNPNDGDAALRTMEDQGAQLVTSDDMLAGRVFHIERTA